VRGEEVVTWVPAGEAEAALLALRAAAARLAGEGFAVDPAAARARPAPPEDEWRDAWKKHFTVTRLGRRIVIVPSWERHEAAPDATRLCLVELERLAAERPAPARFLDMGTGSGILAIAAAKLWPAARGVAVDVDPIAVDACDENLRRNGVRDRVQPADVVPGGGAPSGSAGGGGGAAATPLSTERFELIVANIQADVLEALRDELLARLAPGGAIVLSGLLTPQAAPVAACYGLRLDRVATQDDWAAVVLLA
jgi:ribosomal protein L11 methyltransferase